MKSHSPGTIHWDIVALFALLLLCDTAAQLLFKQGVTGIGEFPVDSLSSILHYLGELGHNLPVLGGALTILVAFFAWLAVISRVDLSKAHLVTSLSFGTVPLCSTWLLHEPFTLKQTIGVLLIMLGAYVASEHSPGHP